MNVSTIIVLLVLAAIVACSIRTMVKSRKSGRGCSGCGGGCSCNCGGCAAPDTNKR